MSSDDHRWEDFFQDMLEGLGKKEPKGENARNDLPEELAEMQMLAQQLQEIGKYEMPDAEGALNRARERVLASVPTPAPAVTPVSPPFWERWRVALAPIMAPAMAWAPAMLIITLTFVVSLGIAVSASVNALPNSPLYPVKQASERALLLFTPPDQRQARLDAITQERIREIKIAQTAGMNIDVPFEGEVQDCEGNICIIDGVAVEVPHGGIVGRPVLSSRHAGERTSTHPRLRARCLPR